MNADEVPKPHPSLFETDCDDDEIRLLSGEKICQHGRDRDGRPASTVKGKAQPLFSKRSPSGGTSSIIALLRSPRAQRPSYGNKSDFASSSTLIEDSESSDAQESDSNDESKSEKAESIDDSAEEEDIDSSEAPEIDGTVIRRRRSQQLSKGRRHQRLSRTAKSGATRSGLDATGQVDNLSGDSGEGERADKSDRSARRSHELSKGRRRQRRTQPVTKSNSMEESTENLSADSQEGGSAENSNKAGMAPRRQRSKPVNPRRRGVPQGVQGEASKEIH